MEELKHILPILLTGSFSLLVFSIGLAATREDLLYVLRRPKLLGRAVLAVNLIPPITAAVLISLFPLQPLAKLGVMLMAVSPVPPMVPFKGQKAGGTEGYAYGLYFALVLLSVLLVPATIAVLDRVFDVDIQISYAAVGKTVLTTVLLPILAGALIHHFAPKPARRIAPLLGKISLGLLVLVFLPILGAAWPDISRLIGNGTVLAMAIVAVVSLLVGHLLGGTSRGDRAVLAYAALIRHPGIAMMIANTNMQNKAVTAAILLFLLVSVIAGALPYEIWRRRKAKHDAA